MEEARDKAVKVGNGATIVYEFTSPDCGYCRKMHKYWSLRSDITRYVFLIGEESSTKAKNLYILAASNQTAALNRVMRGELDGKDLNLAKKHDDGGRLDFYSHLAEQVGISGTPEMFVKGKRVNGADIEQVEEILDGKPAKPELEPTAKKD